MSLYLEQSIEKAACLILSHKSFLYGTTNRKYCKACLTAVGLAGCSSDQPGGDTSGGAADSNQLVLYSSMTDSDLTVLTDLLGQEFPGIEIEIVNGSAGELTTRIQSESGNPQGDMMWGGLDVADGDKYTDIFEHWLSDHENDIQEAYRSPNGFYNVDHLSTAAFCVNKNIEKELGMSIKSYADLLDPKLKGKILMADPTSSSSAWNNISNIMAVFGNDSPEAWDYIKGLLGNGLVIASSSSAAFNSVEDGEYAVGLTYEDGIAALLKSGGQNCQLVYPSEGTSASAFGTAVIKGAPHAATAKKVINYIMSPDGQVALGEALGTLRMTTTAAVDSQYLPATDTITWVDRDVKWLTENRSKVVDEWTEAYTEIVGA